MAPDRRALLADAAISTLAAAGLRGLTHRAVDRAAGLPEGSTSYYFRTRDALLFATLERMAELDAADGEHLTELAGKIGADDLAPLLAGLVRTWLTTGRERALARYELTLESTRRPRLREMLIEHGTRFRMMAEQFLTVAGVDEPRRRGHAMVAFLDGLIFHQLAGVGAGGMDDDALNAACRDLLGIAMR